MKFYWTILTIVILVSAVALWKVREPELNQYNKYMCAVNGYYEDCKTPLRPEDRLK
jgi:hypothetical protein